MKKQSLIKIMLAVLMSMAGAKTFAYDIAAKNADGVTIYYVWANDAKTELAVSYNVRYDKTNSNEYSGNVVIPESVTYDGKDYSVTSIGSYAFYYCSNLTSVTIPNSVTSISNNAFLGCIKLTSVNIPDKVKTIGSMAFFACVSLASVNIPDKVETIGSMAFYGCVGLTSVNIPDKVETIGSMAFAVCSGLIQVTIPNSVTTIESGLFFSCTNLSQVTIPNSVTTIGDGAFEECSSLISVNIPNSVNTIGKGAFASCSSLTSINIPNNIMTIEDGIFGYCTGLTSITIPNSVNSIGKEAFVGCSGLTSITIPSGVTSIGSQAFAKCSGLNSIVSEIENPFTIEKDVFDNDVYSSVQLFVPSGTVAAYKSTDGWSHFKATLVWGEGGYVGQVLSDGTLYYEIGENYTATVKKGEEKLSGDVEILSQFTYNGKTYTVTSIGVNAFSYCSDLTSITIPNSVTTIGDYAFNTCSGLTSVTIPNGVTTIGSNAFLCCGNLTSVIIPNSVTSIGGSAFYQCGKLTSVTIPNSVTSMGSGVFGGCYSLTSVIIGNKVTSIGSEAFLNCYNLTSITIPNSVATIGEEAFQGCSRLVSVVIGSNVKTIGLNAFLRTNLTKTIWLTNTPPSGFNNAKGAVNYVSNDQFTFSNQKKYQLLSSYFEVDGVRYVPVSLSGTEKTCDAIDCIYDESATNINISSSVAYKGIVLDLKDVNSYMAYNNKYIKTLTIDYDGGVPDYAFAGCSNMRSITFGKKVSDIGNNAFFDCSSLEAIKIPDQTVSIGSHAFEKCSSLKEIAIGSHVNTINESAFGGCSSLPSITIPHAVTNINNFVFSGCTSLKNVIIADSDMELTIGVNEVSSYSTGTPLFNDCPLDSVYIGRDISYNATSEYGYSPFYRNSSLRAVKITDKETEISENEFYFCTNLKRVIIGDGITSIGKWAFSGCSSLQFFAFGSELKTIGQEAFSDCSAVVEISSMAKDAPICGVQALDDINKWDCKLYVPSGSLGAYQGADQWKEFIFTEEGTGSIVIDEVLGDATGDGIADYKDLDFVVNSIMEGKNDAKTDINKDGKTDAADVVELVNIIKNK